MRILKLLVFVYLLTILFLQSCGPSSFSVSEVPVEPVEDTVRQDTIPPIQRFNLSFYTNENGSNARRLKNTQLLLRDDGDIVIVSAKDSLGSDYNTLRKTTTGQNHTIKDGIHTVSYTTVFDPPTAFAFLESKVVPIVYQLDSHWELIRIKIGDRIYYSDNAEFSDITINSPVNEPIFHIVRPGHTLELILTRYGLDKETLMELNKDHPSYNVRRGIELNKVYSGSKIRVEWRK